MVEGLESLCSIKRKHSVTNFDDYRRIVIILIAGTSLQRSC